MTSEENLRMFMQDYHRALNAQNYDELVEFLDLPFELALKGKKKTLQTFADVKAAFRMAQAILAERGVFKTVRNVAFVHISDLRESIVGTDETAFDRAGNAIVNWRSSYLLQRRNGLWRICRVNAINHDESWEKIGHRALHAASESSFC